MPTKNAKPRKSKRVYPPHPLRKRIDNADALFVGFGGEFTYDGAILGTATRVVDYHVHVVSKKPAEADVARLLIDEKATLPNTVESRHTANHIDVVVYSRKLIVEIGAQKMKDDGEYKTMDEAREASQEWHDFNTFGAWHGVNTPIFVDDQGGCDE